MTITRAIAWSLLAFLAGGALFFLARASETFTRWWPAVRAVGICFVGVFAFFAGRLFRAWWERRAAKRRERLGLAFDPIRRLRR